MVSWVPTVIGIVGVLAMVGMYRIWLRLFGVVLVPDDKVGIVYKKFVLLGTNRSLPDGAIVALKGEPGLQADTLSPGVHYGFWPWQFTVSIQPFVTIEPGKVGLVESKDGRSLSNGRVLARRVECDSFQNARAFLTGGGERGPQMAIIPPGTYRINTGLFDIEEDDVVEVAQNQVGIVTTTDGAPLTTGDIAGPEVGGHNSYQDGETFIANGGNKGLQEQVLLAGRYYINSMFARVEFVELQTVPIAHVGVVIAYVGKAGHDVTGSSFKHGNLVSKGERGVCVEPLEPGKYPINPHTHKVENVPTANVVLNWATGKTESHQLDKNLSTIAVRSADGFKFNLDVSQIIHIPHNEAPKVIARFGSVSNLVTQVLEPTIGNYFRNAAQASDAIEFLSNRQERQSAAKAAISAALEEYNVGAVDTLIGDIVPPDSLMTTLTDRKIAEQQNITFSTQKLAQDTRKSLEQAKATADTQASVVTAERAVEIAKFNADSAINSARGEAESKKLNAQADAEVTKVTGEADAGKLKAIGAAEAAVIKQKTDAMQQGNYALVEVARALAASGKALVPSIVVAGGATGGAGASVVDMLLLTQLRDQLNNAPPQK